MSVLPGDWCRLLPCLVAWWRYVRRAHVLARCPAVAEGVGAGKKSEVATPETDRFPLFLRARVMGEGGTPVHSGRVVGSAGGLRCVQALAYAPTF